MDVTGPWVAAPADEELRRTYADPAFDDEAWEPVEVPGHWRSTPAFSDCDGPVLYRARFEVADPDDRSWLTLDGLFYQGDVWLDGSYLGDTEGYFTPHEFEVTEALGGRSEHVLAVEVTCDPEGDVVAKHNITGVFQHWDCLDRHWNPGGIWRPVRVEHTGPVRISSLRVLCTEATPARAVMAMRAVLDAADTGPVDLRTTVGGVDDHTEHTLAAGENTVEWTVAVDRPDLWWPHALGGQPLYDVAVEVWLDREGSGRSISHRRTLRTGLRSVRLRNWIASVNGERMFLKGSNQGPTRMDLAEAEPEDFTRDVTLAVDAGLDILRVHAHVSRPEMYEAADRAGLLLWQDMPLQWTYARSVRKQAVRQARSLVDLLGHHPSILLWCGHNEPFRVEDTEHLADPKKVVAMGVRAVAGQMLPSWNKTVLDRSIKRSVEKADGTRPVIAHSGVWPHAPQLDGTDTHVYFGWYHNDERDFPRFLAAWPRMARFVSEFGAQAVPEDVAFMEPERWPDLDWERLKEHHALQKLFFDRRVPPDEYGSFEEWAEATQRYQATVVRHHVEALRRLKYRPTGGFCQFAFADGIPAVTWAVLGHDRAPKAGYRALAEACRPVIVVAERPPAAVAPGDALAWDVHAVSDLRQPLVDAQVTAVLRWDGGDHRWAWGGEIPADACERVGTVQFEVPDAPGPLTLDVELTAESIRATNTYESQIA